MTAEVPTLYEWAGGSEAFERLTAAFYARVRQDDLLEQQGLRKVSPLTIPMLMPNGPAAHVGLELGAKAGVHAPVSACASGAEALAWGWRMIKSGEADVVVAGGAEACITSIPIAGFSQMRAMSTRNGSYGAGPVAFVKVLEDWRAEAGLKGLELS